MLFYGKGITPDLVEAVKWALIAKENGEERAENLFNYYQQEISQELFKEGLNRANAFLEAK
jgi:TPR repeat protein